MPGANTLRILLCGQQGTGKTGWARQAVRRALRAGRRVVILSTKPADYRELVGVQRTFLVREPAAGYSVSRLEGIIRQAQGTFFVFERFTNKTSRPAFAGLVAQAVERVGNILLVIDEAHQYLPRYGTEPHSIGLLTAARARRVDVILITQHPKLLDDVAIKESNAWVLFALPDPNESRYLAELSGVPQERIQRLQVGEYVMHYAGTFFDPERPTSRLDLAKEYGATA